MWDAFAAQFMDLIYALQTAVAWLINAMNWVLIDFWRAFVTLWNWAVEFGGWVWGAIRTVAGGIWRALQALAHLNFSAIWQALKRAYNRVMRTITWLRRRIIEPLDRYRRLILELYNRFWKPVIRFLDSLRVFIRIIGIFNRRLAAQLDAALWRLEARILSPITAALRRINALSSQISAYFTVLGYLDRTLLLESLRRDALLVWEILTNPRGRIFDKPKPPPSRTVADMKIDFHVFVATGGGLYGDYAEHGREVFRDALGGLA
jgi:hypothetical protein